MRYRILINPKTAKWHVQVTRFGLFWRQIANEFNTFYEASNWTIESGLIEGYHYQDPAAYQRLISGESNEWQTKQTRPTNAQPHYTMPSVVRSQRELSNAS